MLKLLVAARRLPSFTRAGFIAYHKHEHTKVFMREADFLQHMAAYTQNHALEDASTADLPHEYALDATRDVVVEVWYADTAAMMRSFVHPRYTSVIQADERAFVAVDDPDSAFLTALEIRGQTPQRHAGGLKSFDFICAARNMPPDAFRSHLLAEVFDRLDRLGNLSAGLVCNLTIPTGSTPPWPAPKYDAVIETWFESDQALHDYHAALARRANSTSSGGGTPFVDAARSRTILTRETTYELPR